MADYTRMVKKLLAENGYRFKRHAKGDHEMWHNPIKKKSVSVDGKIKSRHTANDILDDAGINIKI